MLKHERKAKQPAQFTTVAVVCKAFSFGPRVKRLLNSLIFKSFAIRKKENRNPGSNLDLEPGPFYPNLSV